jgi:membrane peptidoglycan carboxypeptidase
MAQLLTNLHWRMQPFKPAKTQRWEKYLWSFARWVVLGGLLFWSSAALLLVAARWIDPSTTAVQIERRLEAWIHGKSYQKRYQFIPLNQISPDLQHAVIAAEDARFYQHNGFDWHEIEVAAQEDLEGERTRGASTLTQQLVKNLFFGTGRSILRKGAEATPGAGGRSGARQAAHPGDLPERGRMGPWRLWCRVGQSYLLQKARAEH